MLVDFSWITSLAVPCACRSVNVQEALNTAIMLVDVSYPKWRILFCNASFDKATGLSGSDIDGQHVWDHFNVVGKAEVCCSCCVQLLPVHFINVITLNGHKN